MESKWSILTSMKEELIEFAYTENHEIIDENPLVKIEKICNRFHLIANLLIVRHNGHETLDVEDEYYVQDLLHSILKFEFGDIQPEEWSPSYVGKASGVDFLLKKEKIIIEVKKSLSYKEVVD